jgi:hypothetical protein
MNKFLCVENWHIQLGTIEFVIAEKERFFMASPSNPQYPQ